MERKIKRWVKIQRKFKLMQNTVPFGLTLTQNDVGGHDSSPLNRRFLRKDFPEKKTLTTLWKLSSRTESLFWCFQRCVVFYNDTSNIINLELSKGTYWRVSQMFPFWTFQPHRVVSHPSQEQRPTEKSKREPSLDLTVKLNCSFLVSK